MSNPINIETYANGWRAPVSLERMFPDILKSDPRFTAFEPEEIELKKRGVTASNVAGALSGMVFGIGWKSANIPTTLVSFKSCPIVFATFARYENIVEAKFFFQASQTIGSRTWDFRKGAMTICKRTERMSGAEGYARIEFKPVDRFSPGMDELKQDYVLTQRLIEISGKDLIKTGFNLCDITYDIKGGVLSGAVEFNFDHGKKKWIKAVQELGLNPRDYLNEVFNIAYSMADHIRGFFMQNTTEFASEGVGRAAPPPPPPPPPPP